MHGRGGLGPTIGDVCVNEIGSMGLGRGGQVQQGKAASWAGLGLAATAKARAKRAKTQEILLMARTNGYDEAGVKCLSLYDCGPCSV